MVIGVWQLIFFIIYVVLVFTIALRSSSFVKALINSLLATIGIVLISLVFITSIQYFRKGEIIGGSDLLNMVSLGWGVLVSVVIPVCVVYWGRKLIQMYGQGGERL